MIKKILFIVFFAILLAGCASEAAQPQAAQQAVEGGEDIQEVLITENEWGIEPSEIRVAPGRVRFVVTNTGDYPHVLEIEGGSGGEEIEEEVDVPPGTTRTFELTLGPGEYEIYCPLPGHKDRGMEGVVIVE